MGAVLVAVVLLALLVAIGLAFAWQERRSVPEIVPVYSIEDAISFVAARLGEVARQALDRSDIRRILEWEMKYLQNPALRPSHDEPTVVAGINAARYCQAQALASGASYDGPVILEVLQLQAEYLLALGAIGDEVSGGERRSVLERSGEDSDAG